MGWMSPAATQLQPTHRSEYLHAWLTAYQTRSDIDVTTDDARRYQAAALATTTIGRRSIAIFAPFNRSISALITMTRGQIIWLLLTLTALGWLLYRFTLPTVIVLLGGITLIYTGDLLLNLIIAARALNSASATPIDEKLIRILGDAPWPRYTILCPLYREPEVVPQFVDAIRALDYPTDRLQILFLTEENDQALRDVIAHLALPPHFAIVTVPKGKPQTKPRACNYGLLEATGDFVVIYDAEDIPDPLQLKKSIIAFALYERDHPEQTLACVQAQLNFYNVHQNLLTRWFTAEYSLWFDLTLPGLQSLGLPLPLGGTSNHFRTDLLRQVGGWDAFNVTEDCELGLRLARYDLQTTMLDSTTYEEANSRPRNWVRQRSRWIKGYMQTYLVYMRRPWYYLAPRRWKAFVALQLAVGGRSLVLLLNPLMWALVIAYIDLHRHVGVVPLFHELFPGAVLYMGATSLIFGNFLYMYMHLIGCLKRNQLALMKWIVLIPFYWLMMSVAAYLGLFQLIFRPHYWEKTKHGLHLQAASSALDQEILTISPMTAEVDIVRHAPPRAGAVTRELLLVQELQDLHQEFERAQERRQSPRQRDPWVAGIALVAYSVGLLAFLYYYQQHQTVLYGDAYAHMLIARRIFDNATPGVAQLGAVWLPLPHLLMAPFIWNDYLWHTGLAGTIPSLICFVVASVYLFLAARRLTRSNIASLIGTVLFIVNPNVLYLQTTALTEIVLTATFIAAGYYFIAWVQDENPFMLIAAAFATFLATLARYDGWSLAVALLVLIVVINLIKGLRWRKIQGDLFIFGPLAFLGIALWFVWNQLIFKDALYFQRGKFSSEAQQKSLLKFGQLFTYHSAWESLKFYTMDAAQNVGPILLVLASVALVIFFLRSTLWATKLATLAFLTPFAFYVISLYTGQAAMFVPGAVPAHLTHQLYNARYGVAMVAPVGIFVALLATGLRGVQSSRQHVSRVQRWGTVIIQIALVGAIVVQAYLTTTGGIISLQDGQYGLDCSPPHPIVTYLAQHYNGGHILEDLYDDKIDALNPEAQIDFHNIVYEGSGVLWQDSLAHPAANVNWIVVNPTGASGDTVFAGINRDEFYEDFTLDLQEPDGITLYHRNDLNLPTRPIPEYYLTQHSLCNKDFNA